MTDPRPLETDRQIPSLLERWAGPVVIAATFLAMAAISWRKWPDILVDFGRELYVPWRLTAGEVLYRDIAYFNGPFSPCLNALWFRLFGVSFTTLIFCNLAILAVTAAIIYKIFRIACDRLTATLSCCVFLCVFGFAQLYEMSNFNFIAPYSHEMTHGMALASGMILCLSHYVKRPRPHMALSAGFLLGLVFLGKPEVFTAAAAAAALALAQLYVSEPASRRMTAAAALLFAGAMFVPVGLFTLLLARDMPVSDALHGIVGAWDSLLHSKVASNLFYREGMGLDRPLDRIATMVQAWGGVTLIGLALAIADLARKLSPKAHKDSKAHKEMLRAIGASLIVFAAACFIKQPSDPWLAASWLPVPWLILGSSLTLATFAVGLVIIPASARYPSGQKGQKAILLAMWTVFAFVLLGKILLAPRLSHYGFALAMPATLLLVAVFVSYIPGMLERSQGGDLFRRFAVAMIVADLLFYAGVSQGYYKLKTTVIAGGGDTLLAFSPKNDPRGTVMAKVLTRIDTLMPPQGTFLVLPEGVMLNYLSRRVNPTPYVSFLPPEIAMFGEANMLASMQKRPPDFIVIVVRGGREFGVGMFGSSAAYGKQTMEWVESHYSTVERVAADPPWNKRFDIRILKRLSP